MQKLYPTFIYVKWKLRIELWFMVNVAYWSSYIRNNVDIANIRPSKNIFMCNNCII